MNRNTVCAYLFLGKHGDKIVSAIAHGRKSVRDFPIELKLYPPVGSKNTIFSSFFGLGNVFTACQSCCRSLPRISEETLRFSLAKDPALFHNQKLLGKAIELVPRMGNHNTASLEVLQMSHEFLLHPVPKRKVQCGKGFVKKDDFRFSHQNPRKSRSLLLPAG